MIPPVGKSGPGKNVEDFIDRAIRVVDQQHHRIADFDEVVRRHAGRHAHGNPGGAVDEQVRKPPRQDDRLGHPLVVSRDEIDRVAVDVLQHLRRDRREPGFRVTLGGRRQTGERTEVALLVHQHRPHHPVLGEADQRGIQAFAAVRVVVPAGVAGDLRALDPPAARAEVQVVHRDQNPPLRGFQSVPRIRKRPADDDRHRIGEIAVSHLILDVELLNAAVAGDTGRWLVWLRPITEGEISAITV